MAALITPIPVVAFPHELDSLQIQADGDPTLGCSVEMRLAGAVIYKAQLAYNEDELIFIHNVAELLRMNASSGVSRLNILLDGYSEGECNVVPCKIDLDDNAASFTDRHFLTRCGGRKYASPWSYEELAFYTTKPNETLTESVSVFDGEAIRDVVIHTKTFTNPGLYYVPVDMADIVGQYGQVTKVDIKVGSRSMTYLIRNREISDFSVQFRNCFNQLEYWTFRYVESKLNMSYKSAVFKGVYRNYQTNAHKELKAFFNFMLPTEVGIVEDLAMATEVMRMPDNVPLLVTAADFTDSSDIYAEKGGSITFRNKDVIIKAQSDKPVNTFDHTFDDTFK